MSNPVQTTRATGSHAGLLLTDEEGTLTHLSDRATVLLDEKLAVGEALSAQKPDIARYEQQARDGNCDVRFDDVDGSENRRLSGTVSPVDGGVAVVFDDPDTGERTLERLHDVATDPTLTTRGKIEQMLAVGTDRLGTEYGFLARVEDETHEIIAIAGSEERPLEPGMRRPLSATYCRHTLDSDGTLSITEAGEELPEDRAYAQTGIECYLGVTIRVTDEQYGTVCFIDPEPRGTAFTEGEQTFAELLTNWIHYLLEQESYERELKQQQAFTESLIDSLPDPLYAFNQEGELIRWNDRLKSVTGLSDAELEGIRAVEFVADEDRERIESTTQQVQDGTRISVEAMVNAAEGTQIPYEFSGAPLRDGNDEVIGVVGVGRDISERTEHQRRLSGLLETTRSFMQAEDPQEVAEIAVNAARDLLGFEISVFRLYDAETQTLTPAAATAQAREMLGERPVYDVGSGNPGEVFATGESRIISDTQATDADTPAPVRSVMYYPVGVRGTMSVCSTEPDAFDESDEQLLALLATSAAAACTRAKRERDVREAREHTERVLDRVNGLVRQTVEVLVAATTRDELEADVVAELAAAEPYSIAWVARPDVTSQQVTPTAWAGETDGAIGEWTFDRDDPIGSVFEGDELQLLDSDAGTGEPWEFLATEVEALVAIPLGYKDTSYGVLVVGAEDVTALDEREQAVLGALGRATANAINAVERGRILDATKTIELSLAISDPELLFNQLATGDERIESVGSESRADGRIKHYLAATNVDPEAFTQRVRAADTVESVTVIVANENECLLDVVVTDSLLGMVTEYGAVPQEVIAENGTTRITVDLPYEAEARELFDIVDQQYPGTDLLGYHERERPVETRQDFTASLSDRLTERQETALRTAYLGGFFDWPRGVDGNDLADAMDISRPTFHQHLRAAQEKVFAELFE